MRPTGALNSKVGDGITHFLWLLQGLTGAVGVEHRTLCPTH